MSITKDDVLATFPELAGSVPSDAQWTQILAMVDLQVSNGAWGSTAKGDLGRKWLAAHYAAAAKTDAAGGGSVGVSGALTKITVGQVSKEYADGSATSGSVDNSALASTRYGQEYIRLLKLFAPRFIVT